MFWNNIQCVAAGVNTLMSISDGLKPYISGRKMEKTRSMRDEMDGNVFIFRQSRHFSSVKIMIKVLFLTFTLAWLANNYIFCQGSEINWKIENTITNLLMLLLFVAQDRILLIR